MERTKQILIDALRAGVDQAEVRLYRAGRLPGLFSGKTSLNTELARKAVADGLIEIVRAETRGKTPVEFVRVTPKGVELVLNAESPVRALEELRSALEVNRDGIPTWLGDLHQQIDELGQRLVSEVASMRERIDGMMERVQEALKRADKYGPPPPEGAANALPWAHDVIDYLDGRPRAGFQEKCPLPELFGHVKERDQELTIHEFHSGLRRLYDRGLVRLFPADESGPAEPEYALLDGACVYYFVARQCA